MNYGDGEALFVQLKLRRAERNVIRGATNHELSGSKSSIRILAVKRITLRPTDQNAYCMLCKSVDALIIDARTWHHTVKRSKCNPRGVQTGSRRSYNRELD